MKIKGEYANSSLILKQGIIIDLAKNSYTKFNKFLNLLRFKDAPRPLPTVDYILLFKTIYTKCQPHTVKEFEDSSIIQVSLVFDKNKKLIVNESKDADYAMKLARQLADKLAVKIRDSATDRRNPTWLS